MQVNSSQNSWGASPWQALRETYQSANNGQGLEVSDDVKHDVTQLKADKKAGNVTAIQQDKETLKSDFIASLQAQGVSNNDIEDLQAKLQEPHGAHHGHHGHHGHKPDADNPPVDATTANPALTAYQASSAVDALTQPTELNA